MAASPLALFFTFLAILAATNTAEEFEVGDAVGWRVPAVNETELYNVWASRRRFHVGDSLSFHYKQNDLVVVVEKWGYYHCDASSPISVFNDGDTVITLNNPGPIYFISGNDDRCKEGQRMIVNVMVLHPISHFPPSIATPPQPYFDMSPSPSRLSRSEASVQGKIISVLVMGLIVSLVGQVP